MSVDDGMDRQGYDTGADMTGKTCCKRVYDGYHSHECGKKAKVQVDGLAYCGLHDPVKRQAKQEERNRQWKERWDASNAERDRQDRLQAAERAVVDAAIAWRNGVGWESVLIQQIEALLALRREAEHA